MKILTVFLLSVFLVSSIAISQDDIYKATLRQGLGAVGNDVFGADVIVSNFRPIGPIAAIHKQNPSTIYIAVNDTFETQTHGIVILQSTNDGISWSKYPYGVPFRERFERIRLVRTGQDSVYLAFLRGNQIYIWSFLNSIQIALHDSMNVRDFDIVASSTGGLYVFADHIGTNNIRRYGTLNGGWTWVQTGLVTSSGAFPRLCMSGTGDTLFLNYYGAPFGSDTSASIIRVARYRETSTGYLTSAGFQDLATESVSKYEFITAAYGGVVWFFYTHGSSGNIDLKLRGSTDGGMTYSAPYTFPSSSNVDEYWIDAKYFMSSPGGVDLCYYRDSLQGGQPDNNSDKLISTYAFISNPGSFSNAQQISNHPPGWSTAKYIPQVVEELPLNNYGFVWVGLDAPSSWRLYYDASNITTSLRSIQTSVPESFVLHQNYPNPFNPSTKIKFDIPGNSFVTLKIFDMLGREVQVLVSENLAAGSYSVDFNGSSLTGGVYFCKLESNGKSDVKKMMLVK